MTSLERDPRWQRFNDSKYTCPCCGQSFSGIFDIAFDHPFTWPHGNRGATEGAVLEMGDDRLDAETCTVDGHHYLRCLFFLPVIGAGTEFAFGCWGSLSDESWNRYQASERQSGASEFAGCFSWLANTLPTFERSDHVACNLFAGPPGERPRLQAKPGTALHESQSSGISFDRLLDIYAASGMDIRPHLG